MNTASQCLCGSGSRWASPYSLDTLRLPAVVARRHLRACSHVQALVPASAPHNYSSIFGLCAADRGGIQ
jgi:hypothetical protein